MNSTIFEQTNDGMKLDYMVSYSQFLVNQQLDDRKLAIATLDESTMLYEQGELISLNEGFISSIIEFLKKLVNNIAQVIDRFVADIRKVIGMDSKFLAEHRDKFKAIKRIEVGDKIENWRDYSKAEVAVGAESGALLRFKSLNNGFDDIKNNLEAWKDIPSYVTSVHLAGIDKYEDTERITLKNRIIQEIVGGSKTMTDVEITTEDNVKLWERMYNFCYKGYNAALDSIRSDKEAINKNNDIVMGELDKLKRGEENKVPETPEQSQTTTTTTTTTSSSSTSTGTPGGTNETAVDFDSTMKLYFNEEEVNQNPTNTSSTSGGEAQQTTISHDTSSDDNNEKKEKDEYTKKVSAAIQSFYNANSQMLSAKMKICMNMYKQYMKLLRWYISRVDVEIKKDKKDEEADTSRPIRI